MKQPPHTYRCGACKKLHAYPAKTLSDAVGRWIRAELRCEGFMDHVMSVKGRYRPEEEEAVSTRCSIKSGPGYHIWIDCFETDRAYFEFDQPNPEVIITADEYTVRVPAEVAQTLGIPQTLSLGKSRPPNIDINPASITVSLSKEEAIFLGVVPAHEFSRFDAVEEAAS